MKLVGEWVTDSESGDTGLEEEDTRDAGLERKGGGTNRILGQTLNKYV